MDTLPPILWAEQFFATFAEAAKPIKRTHEECPAYKAPPVWLTRRLIQTPQDIGNARKCTFFALEIEPPRCTMQKKFDEPTCLVLPC